MGDRILVIDEGTSSTRAMLVDAEGRTGAMAQRDLTTSYPRPGWVEQDAEQIWRLTLEAAREAIGEDGARVAGIGITNQRETIVFWDRDERCGAGTGNRVAGPAHGRDLRRPARRRA